MSVTMGAAHKNRQGCHRLFHRVARAMLLGTKVTWQPYGQCTMTRSPHVSDKGKDGKLKQLTDKQQIIPPQEMHSATRWWKGWRKYAASKTEPYGGWNLSCHQGCHKTRWAIGRSSWKPKWINIPTTINFVVHSSQNSSLFGWHRM